jgi:hypothetical protein
VLLIVVVSGLVNTSDRAYATQVPLRERQVRCQGALDAVAKEIREGRTSAAWLCPVSGETLPADVQAPFALVVLSARDGSGRFIASGTSLLPVWQKAVIYAPLNVLDSSGECALHRFEIFSVPPTPTSARPVLAVTPTNVRLEWVPLAGGPFLNPPGSIQIGRAAGVCVLPRLVRFVANNPKLTATTADDFTLPGGSTWAPDLWTLGVSCALRLEGGRTLSIKADSTIQGRN